MYHPSQQQIREGGGRRAPRTHRIKSRASENLARMVIEGVQEDRPIRVDIRETERAREEFSF